MARIRASARGKTDAVAAVARDIDFRHLWRQSRGAGWTSKRPRDMQSQWSPGGVHSFVGEDAVVVHAIESGLLGDVDDVESEVDAVGEGVEAAEVVAIGNEGRAEADGDEDIRPSQIDTSAQLSQNTLNELFGSESDSEVDLSQAAVTRAFDVSPGDLHAADSQRDCDANLQQLSEVSRAESDGAQVDAAAVETTRALRPRVHVKKDVNYVPQDEKPPLPNMDLKRSFAPHWSMTEDGAVPAGNFGWLMGRIRCQEILRDLHFVDNEADRTRDKLWKLRPVIDKLQQRFLAGWTLPAVFSFDEGVLPSTFRRNTTRMFTPDKPHRYGSQMFMLCDSRTAYCHRFEMYAGKRNPGEGGDTSFDHMTGDAAVVRNMKMVLESKQRHPWHLVVVDRFYSPILLAIELLRFDKQVKEQRKTRSAAIPRGFFLFSRSTAVPSMVAFHWWDRKPVHYLCTGSSMAVSSIQRNPKRVGPETVPCPAAVNDYQRWMGGVDVHDQLRLQRFSLQTSTRFTKYYKCLFLGFVDLALVNAYISHKETARLAGTPSMSRGDCFCILQNQLLQLKAADFAGVDVTPPANSQKRRRTHVRLSHALEKSEDWVTVSGVQKRRQRSCKVRALLRSNPKKKSYATTFYCERCSVDSAKCWLCNKIRHSFKGVTKTCFAIWHEDFECGQSIPVTLGKKVVLRRPGQVAGERKKTRRELELHEDDAEGEECETDEV
ncbi:hypothetical protein PPTG_06182 [Phytophthora nicotianae INRA-310]|uniref:PiggyBac transposable element-derived protein domain-containing protein n=1 Tax=Phytophthora nicotianae (strain INRA-310) TaxID=761204 RepID=W2QTU9_PHYN3|nr:hypothetical protein PPTG_06182 [Phytophthora nicotianae INRA-310]ETN15919.1 hypothetical protein PPTG_06182 [Phytophthora nicotianae INRA-310]